jgi:hypothetical protein
MTPSAEVGGINLTLQPIRTVGVRGRVTAPALAVVPEISAGRGGRGGRVRTQIVMRRQAATANGNAVRDLARIQFSASANASGEFEIDEVIPGDYLLTAVQRAGDQVFSARTPLQIGAADLDNVAMLLEPGTSVPGQIQIGAATLPQNFRIDRVRVQISPVDDLQEGNTTAQVRQDGSFVLNNVAPIEYRISVSGLPAGGYLAAGRYGSQDALAAPLEIGKQELPLSLQIGFSPGRVSGVVTNSVDEPYPGVTFVLIPAVRYRNDLYKTASTDQYGRFTFASVAPGVYKVFAWEDLPQGAHLDESFVARFEERGSPLKIDENGTATVPVRVIPIDAP